MHTSPTILLVEDEAITGMAEARSLEQEGYRVIHVLNGAEALELFHKKEDPIDLILMDIDLGHALDGTITAQEILKTHDVPILFLSSHTEKEIVEKTEKITSYGYVAKNSGITVLTASIKMAFKLHEAYRKLMDNENNIRESEKQYRITFENTGTATVILEENSIITLANAEFERLSGCTKEEIEGKKTWTDFVVEEDLEMMRARHRMRRENREASPKKYEFRFKTQSGDIRNIFLTIDLIPGTKRSIASLMDITDRVKAQAELRESEERYRQLVENAGESIVVAQNNMLKYANPMTRTLFGFSEEELYGRAFLEFIHPEDRGMVAERYQSRIAGDDFPSVYEFRILHKDGGFRWVEINVVKFLWESSPATLNFFKDITARKIAEMKLQESEERFRTLIESAPMAIAISRATRFTYVNQKFLQMFGYEKMEDLIGKPISDMVIEEDAATFMERARKREEGADVDTRYNTTGQHRNGTRFPVTAAVARVDFPDGPATIGFFQDNSGS